MVDGDQTQGICLALMHADTDAEVVDNGEGQTPRGVPHTILSLHAGNKNRIPFVQGKFNMGGTGVLEFCGRDRNLQLVVSRRNPALLPRSLEHPSDADWSFTVVRRE